MIIPHFSSISFSNRFSNSFSNIFSNKFYLSLLIFALAIAPLTSESAYCAELLSERPQVDWLEQKLGLTYGELGKVNEAVSIEAVSIEGQGNEAQLGSFQNRATLAGEPEYFLCNKAKFNFGSGDEFGGSEVWGWRSPGGVEYAIMGTIDGLSIVDANSLTLASEVSVPVGACSYYWRDMKTYQNYLYLVSDCGGATQGLSVFDLSFLPDSARFVGEFLLGDVSSTTSHNLSIDTVKGFLYAEGLNVSGGGYSVFIHDLADPENPVYVNRFGPVNIHDLYVRNDTAYLAEATAESFSIWDVSNKMAPALLARINVPGSGYCHNVWPTEDGKHMVTTEEVTGHTIKIWNIEDLFDIQLVGEYIAPSLIPHNVHVKGDRIYLSHYQSGVRVIDISIPSNPTELGFFDTYPSADSAVFSGCWGVYPHTQNGTVYASNMDGSLFIFEETERVVGDSLFSEDSHGAPGGQVIVNINATNSLPVNFFAVPFAWSGAYNMTFDSASIVGTRTAHFEELEVTSIDPFNRRAGYSIKGSSIDPNLVVEAGAGVILKLYFRLPPGASGASNSVLIVAHSGQSPAFGTSCLITVDPVVVSGVVTLSCCQSAGDGNDDGVTNIADVTFLIARIFGGGPAPACAASADANGSGQFNIADVTYLINWIFGGGPNPICG